MQRLFSFLFLMGVTGVFADVRTEELSPVHLTPAVKWQVVKISDFGEEKKELFTAASPQRMALRHQGPWLMLACNGPDKSLFTIRFRNEARYPTPESYGEFRKAFLKLMGGLYVLEERRVRWNKPGIVYRMDLDVSKHRTNDITHKISVMATKDSFYILNVGGDTTNASEFFDRFTALS